VRAAKEADAQWIGARVLYLMPAALKQFLPFVQAKFPRLARQYDEWYRRHNGAPKSYTDEITNRFAALRKKYGINSRPELPVGPPGGPPQMSLGLVQLESSDAPAGPQFKHLPGMPVLRPNNAVNVEMRRTRCE
jgi:hypothetical protein